VQLLKERFDSLARSFGESVRVISEIKPDNEPHSGELAFAFESPLATIQMKFGFFHDSDFRDLVIDYDLRIIRVFLKFEPQSRLEQKIESFDEDLAAQWLDDRIVAFVRTYMADQMVEDPIAQMRFPKYAAETTLQKEGITYYFISAETKRDFQNGRPQDKNSHRHETFCEVGGS
jgi:YHS domain-containing protein